MGIAIAIQMVNGQCTNICKTTLATPGHPLNAIMGEDQQPQFAPPGTIRSFFIDWGREFAIMTGQKIPADWMAPTPTQTPLEGFGRRQGSPLAFFIIIIIFTFAA